MTKLLYGFGLPIQSEVDIPGCVAAPGGVSVPVVKIRQTRCVRRNGEPLYRMDQDAIIFAPPDVGEFRISRDSIDIQLWPDADRAYATDLLIATALPALLWLRGHFMLHAAGVQLPGEPGVTAIAGRSGSGKSTVARQLLEAGANLIGDDSLCLTQAERQFLASGLPGGIHVWNNGERVFQPLASGQTMPLPLQRIIVLTETGDVESLSVCGGVDAVEMLLAHAHRPKVPALLGRRADNIITATAVARSVTVLQWTRQMGDLTIDPSVFRDMVTKNIPGDKK